MSALPPRAPHVKMNWCYTKTIHVRQSAHLANETTTAGVYLVLMAVKRVMPMMLARNVQQAKLLTTDSVKPTVLADNIMLRMRLPLGVQLALTVIAYPAMRMGVSAVRAVLTSKGTSAMTAQTAKPGT